MPRENPESRETTLEVEGIENHLMAYIGKEDFITGTTLKNVHHAKVDRFKNGRNVGLTRQFLNSLDKQVDQYHVELYRDMPEEGGLDDQLYTIIASPESGDFEFSHRMLKSGKSDEFYFKDTIEYKKDEETNTTLSYTTENGLSASISVSTPERLKEYLEQVAPESENFEFNISGDSLHITVKNDRRDHQRFADLVTGLVEVTNSVARTLDQHYTMDVAYIPTPGK